MAPKPRQTFRTLPPSSSTNTASFSPPPPTKTRRKRWVYDKPTLILLLLLHGFCHILAFILLTEPCLNPTYVNSLWSKTNYLSLLTTEGLIPKEEWKERFLKAALRGLFGVGVVQAWFVARLNSYIQKGSREHSRLVSALKAQREAGAKVGISLHRNQEKGVQVPLPATQKEEQESEEVGSFIRQLESVSMTFLGLPFIWFPIVCVMILFGAPITNFYATAIIAAYLTFLLALPIIHILGIPPSSSSTPKYYTTILQLDPSPTFLYPLFYPLIFSSFATLLSSLALVLDWNTAWQTYPYPLLVGALVGLVAGDVYTLLVILFT